MDKKKMTALISLGAVTIIAIVVGVIAVLSSMKNIETPKPVQVSTATPEPVPTPEPTEAPVDHGDKVKSRLTGEYISKKVAAERPFSIMINNIEYANLRQRGTSKLDIVYEALAEGGITRMLGVFQGVKKIKTLGSVRSARHYYVSFSDEWDSIFCHFGQTKYAISKMKELKTNNLSGLSAIGGVVYRRDNSVKPPHNVYTDGKKILKGAKKLKYRTKIKESKMAEHFDFYEEDTDLESGDNCKYVYLPFSYYSICYLKYDSKAKVYKKFEYKKKHMDHKYNKQLQFKNVIIQLVKEKNIDKNGYQHLSLHRAHGKGYYISNGKCTKITWRKSEEDGEMCYYNEDGDKLTINPGKTYIAAYPKNRAKLIKLKKKK
ncbi:DUF3048 domain-containing protein [Eubacterium xylanophilum]|uniref:DUF3048 domain-containing protein n=1 Tax=Eubacterium xylanophilum TaxID=39497 RepID=UPI000479B403|nr:DUF3048 domain-containing protein [Eubacterium xylanophilum]